AGESPARYELYPLVAADHRLRRRHVPGAELTIPETPGILVPPAVCITLDVDGAVVMEPTGYRDETQRTLIDLLRHREILRERRAETELAVAAATPAVRLARDGEDTGVLRVGGEGLAQDLDPG